MSNSDRMSQTIQINETQFFNDFVKEFELFIKNNINVMNIFMSNIFTIRLIGNKTHGDLLEIGMVELINKFMSDYEAKHVGKELYRAKRREEDISILNKINGNKFNASLKAYGHGNLQLSTDKNNLMFTFICQTIKDGLFIDNVEVIRMIFNHIFDELNVIPFIYDEKNKKCNILIFNHEKMKNETVKIVSISEGGKRKHPVFKFLNKDNNSICEVRYGGKAANALQRGLWTNTKNAEAYFTSITDGWMNYDHNTNVISLISSALIASETGHKKALSEIINDINIIGNKNVK